MRQAGLTVAFNSDEAEPVFRPPRTFSCLVQYIQLCPPRPVTYTMNVPASLSACAQVGLSFHPLNEGLCSSELFLLVIWWKHSQVLFFPRPTKC